MKIQYSKAAVNTILPDIDDIATPDDLQAIREYEREKAAGVTISHDDIDWD